MEEEIKSIGKEAKEGIETVAKELKINVPNEKVSFILNIIAFFTILPALNLIASTFIDTKISTTMYISRLILGLIAIAVAYGILEKERWAIWLYGFLAIIMLSINPIISLLPIVIVIYLYTQRRHFKISIFDKIYFTIREKIKDQIAKNKK